MFDDKRRNNLRDVPKKYTCNGEKTPIDFNLFK